MTHSPVVQFVHTGKHYFISEEINEDDLFHVTHSKQRGGRASVDEMFETSLTDEEFSSKLLDTIKSTNGMRTFWCDMPEVNCL